MTEIIRIRTGSVAIDFDGNFRRAVENMRAGRPLDDGWVQPRHVPDPSLPEWIELTIA